MFNDVRQRMWTWEQPSAKVTLCLWTNLGIVFQLSSAQGLKHFLEYFHDQKSHMNDLQHPRHYVCVCGELNDARFENCEQCRNCRRDPWNVPVFITGEDAQEYIGFRFQLNEDDDEVARRKAMEDEDSLVRETEEANEYRSIIMKWSQSLLS